jgi:hypothetical protein
MQPLAPPPRLLHCFRRKPKTPYKQPVTGNGRPRSVIKSLTFVRRSIVGLT